MTPGRDAFQALLGFSYLQQEVRQRRNGNDWQLQELLQDEVLHLVAERALAITGADGTAIALADGNDIVCRAATGTIAPDPGARLDPNSGFSGACFRTREVIRCDDADNDPRVNANAARRLHARSLIAVPLKTATSVIGLIEAFSFDAYAFNDTDVRSLQLLSELILAAMRPEEENRLAEIAERVATQSTAAVEVAQPISSAPEKVVSAETPAQPPTPSVVVGAERHSSSPGLKVVLAVVLAASAVGLGVWWHMHHSTQVANTTTVKAAAPATPATSDNEDPLASEASLPPTDPSKQKLAVLPLVNGIRHWSTPEASTVVVDLQDQVQYEAHRLTNPERIYFDLHDTALAAGLVGNSIEVGDALLTRIRIAQPMVGVTRVVLEIKGGSNFSVSLEPDPYRLVVELRAVNAPQQLRQKIDLFSPPQSGDIATRDAHLRASLPKFRIVLDPGHGGWDLGTVGREGLLEKDLALDVVRRLGNLLYTRCGADVIYTRQDDTYIPLEKRTEIANQAEADLFVSIHANYSDDHTARGIETYYSHTFSSLSARSRDGHASLEGVSFAKLDIRDKVQQSHRFAATVQHALYAALVTTNPGLPNRGVKEASYVVLTGTAMPAILAEISFVSSPTDEEKLTNSAYRQQIAEALYKGVVNYAGNLPHADASKASARSAGQ